VSIVDSNSMAASALKDGALVVLKNGLRMRLQDSNVTGDTRRASIDGADGMYCIKTTDIEWARIGAFLVPVKHNSGESK
jgi:hypothetical protein